MKIQPKDFYKYLKKDEIDFFTGVPDSLLKDFCLCIDDKLSNKNHIIAANEGNAIAIASGYHLGTGKVPLVYMQNSGLGNAINPLLSLSDSEVYSIPLLLLIGWRGEPGIKDEPQHVKQGKIQIDLLKIMNIPFQIISEKETDVEKKIAKVINIAKIENRPTAILIKKGTFDKYKQPTININNKLMSREESLEIILDNLPDGSIIVSTTGKTSREIFELRVKNNKSHHQDFLTVGSMGHCSSIALGLAIAKPKSKIFCIDGDGSLIMHMGSLSIAGKIKPENFFHILINNQVHESVGGQKTSANVIDFLKVAKSSGYSNLFFSNNFDNLKSNLLELINSLGPSFLEVFVKPGSRKSLGRPTIEPNINKKSFMSFLRE
jgi:phosphonopyruvate decarboxylase